MFEKKYWQQVNLLLEILPELNEFPQLALHGGTAINLFYRAMPRLSVDLDLTWTQTGSREHDLRGIKNSLHSLRNTLVRRIPHIQVRLNETQPGLYKLYCQRGGAQVKVEVNTVNRGLLEAAQLKPLNLRAQEVLERFCEVQLVGYGQLFGGKWVAALDRQHPRDIFDIMVMLDAEGYTPSLHRGLLFCLLSSNRPIHELLAPTRLDQRQALNRVRPQSRKLDHMSSVCSSLFESKACVALKIKEST